MTLSTSSSLQLKPMLIRLPPLPQKPILIVRTLPTDSLRLTRHLLTLKISSTWLFFTRLVLETM
jgi:hypothetical protein